MANTKTMSRDERKTKKRAARKVLKEEYRKLNPGKRAEFEKKCKGGLKGFILGTNEDTE